LLEDYDLEEGENLKSKELQAIEHYQNKAA